MIWLLNVKGEQMSEEIRFGDDFLECLLKAFFNEDKDCIEKIINFDIVKRVVISFQAYFTIEDEQHNTCHSVIIKKLFAEKVIVNNKDCSSKLGVSLKTFYRYKQRYISVFRDFLMKFIDYTAHDAELHFSKIREQG